MLTRPPRNRFVSLLAFGGLGAAIGFVVARGGFSIVCALVDHSSWEEMTGAWYVFVFTIVYGVFGATWGFRRLKKS